MRTAQGSIDFLYADISDTLYPDPINDFPLPHMNGFVTWRNQELLIPEGMLVFLAVPLADTEEAYSPDFVDRLVRFGGGKVTPEEADKASRKFNKDIWVAVINHRWPKYVHSGDYIELMRLVKIGDKLSWKDEDFMRKGAA